MATVNLGRIKPIFKGAYAGGTAYVVDDIVTSGNETFICILASTGNATSNATYWTKLASKGADGSNGSNGTDLSTTLTTQGDILYRDGSGLQRLAKGTAGQELRINSGATAPEWYTPATASSDYVKISSGTVSSASVLDLEGTSSWGASNTYSHHKLFLRAKPSQNGTNLNMRLLTTSSGLITDNIYNFANNYIGSHNNTGTSSSIVAGEGTDNFQITRDGVNTGGKQIFDFDIYNMNYGSSINANDDCFKYSAHLVNINHDDTARMHGTSSYGSISRGSAPSNQGGTRLYFTGGNITADYHIYGIKK